MQHEGFLENKVVPEKYRHVPNRDDHHDSHSDDEDAPSCSNGDASNGEPPVKVEPDSFLTQCKTEPPESMLLMQEIANAPSALMDSNSFGSSPVKVKLESPMRYQTSPRRSAPSLSSPLKTEQVSPMKTTLTSARMLVLSPKKEVDSSPESQQQQNSPSPMSASEETALAALASLSSYSTEDSNSSH